MSAASDVTAFRDIIARYSVGATAQSAWATTQPISTSSTVTAGKLALSSQSIGIATLTGASTTVSAPACTTNSFVFITAKNISGSQGTLSAVAGSGSFIINTTNAGDRSTVQWMIVNPA